MQHDDDAIQGRSPALQIRPRPMVNPGSSNSASIGTFPRFLELPVELQRQIWEWSLVGSGQWQVWHWSSVDNEHIRVEWKVQFVKAVDSKRHNIAAWPIISLPRPLIPGLCYGTIPQVFPVPAPDIHPSQMQVCHLSRSVALQYVKPIPHFPHVYTSSFDILDSALISLNQSSPPPLDQEIWELKDIPSGGLVGRHFWGPDGTKYLLYQLPLMEPLTYADRGEKNRFVLMRLAQIEEWVFGEQVRIGHAPSWVWDHSMPGLDDALDAWEEAREKLGAKWTYPFFLHPRSISWLYCKILHLISFPNGTAPISDDSDGDDEWADVPEDFDCDEVNDFMFETAGDTGALDWLHEIVRHRRCLGCDLEIPRDVDSRYRSLIKNGQMDILVMADRYYIEALQTKWQGSTQASSTSW